MNAAESAQPSPDPNSGDGATERTSVRTVSRPSSAARHETFNGTVSHSNGYPILRRYPILSMEEFARRLYAYRETQDPNIRRSLMEEMVCGNMWMVIAIAARYLHSGAELPELVQEGTIGLMRGIKKFEPRYGLKLVTYAQHWIRNEIDTFVYSQYGRRGYRVPIRIARNRGRMHHVMTMFEMQYGRTPTAYETYLELKKDDERRRARIEKLGRKVKGLSFRTVVRLYAEDEMTALRLDASRPDGVPFHHFVPNRCADAQTALETAELSAALQETIRRGLASLIGREPYVLRQSMGMDGTPAVSLSEIGRHLGISRERVRQLQMRAIRRFCTATGLSLNKRQFMRLIESGRDLETLAAAFCGDPNNIGPDGLEGGNT
jgi:RNA polymerase sigma factor (sigma-70 family)